MKSDTVRPDPTRQSSITKGYLERDAEFRFNIV